MTPATFDFDVVRGSAGPTQGLTLNLRTKNLDNELVPMLFDDVRLSIYDKTVDKADRELLVRATFVDGGIQETDSYQGQVSWIPTTEETRALKIGAKNHYELEVRTGTDEIIYLLGVITGIGGLNDDESDLAS